MSIIKILAGMTIPGSQSTLVRTTLMLRASQAGTQRGRKGSGEGRAAGRERRRGTEEERAQESGMPSIHIAASRQCNGWPGRRPRRTWGDAVFCNPAVWAGRPPEGRFAGTNESGTHAPDGQCPELILGKREVVLTTQIFKSARESGRNLAENPTAMGPPHQPPKTGGICNNTL